MLPALLLPLAVLAEPAPTPDDNRQQLDRWKQDPQRYARLVRSLAAFNRLPAENQDRLRKLNRDLGEESPGMKGRLTRVMDRYQIWLDRLPDEDRKHVESAPDRKTRLQRIRDLRMRDFVKQLPKAEQELVKNTREVDRPAVIQKLWQEDWEQRADWLVLERFGDAGTGKVPMPANEEMLPGEAKRYLEKVLRPLLSKEEEKRLKEAEGKWPRYVRVLVELGDEHPYSVLGPIGPLHVEDLKKKSKAIFKEKELRERLKEHEGKWPEFGAAIRDMGKMLPRELLSGYTPQHLRSFPPNVQQFVEKRLLPALTEEERQLLTRSEGHWPHYPRAIVELARKHNLMIPSENTLPPGPIDWDKYRTRSLSSGESWLRRADP